MLQKADPAMIGYIMNNINKAVHAQDTRVITAACIYVAARAANMWRSVKKEEWMLFCERAYDLQKKDQNG